ncbi:hypothetical protein QBC37DRAFT_408164 [Rhypophila decipiens]|uniref:Mitochondrial ribosomal protein S11 n=1 Tax=Rhypophila decipiens TaxID=261697 RepID=A0AAN7BG37_9PEZI|nr:hypothetical protein QBC37DRAFT_408164 [Rhypophila decipiens]
MSRVASSRLLARNIFTAPCTARSATPWSRCYSSIPNNFGQPNRAASSASSSTGSSVMADIAARDHLFADIMSKAKITPDGVLSNLEIEEPKEPYHFHIYSHKHNTHITVTDPNRDAIISMSCGNLGLRNAQRKSYDAAYQLAAYVVDKLNQTGVVKKIHKLEVVLRGFGPGREAATKVLMGTEGKLLKPLIVRVTDSTRVKFGGTRSQRKRRLG